MNNIIQFSYIIGMTFLGELLNTIIPLPIPASIYGICILFILLSLKVIKIDDIEKVGLFLIEIMPIMFIPSAVGIMNSWNLLKQSFVSYMIIVFVSTLFVMLISGKVVDYLMKKEKKL